MKNNTKTKEKGKEIMTTPNLIEKSTKKTRSPSFSWREQYLIVKGVQKYHARGNKWPLVCFVLFVNNLQLSGERIFRFLSQW
jgi:hypothetical protein